MSGSHGRAREGGKRRGMLRGGPLQSFRQKISRRFGSHAVADQLLVEEPVNPSGHDVVPLGCPVAPRRRVDELGLQIDAGNTELVTEFPLCAAEGHRRVAVKADGELRVVRLEVLVHRVEDVDGRIGRVCGSAPVPDMVCHASDAPREVAAVEDRGFLVPVVGALRHGAPP